MKYERPLIVYAADALSAVQGGKESGGGDSESDSEVSINAYQADE